MELVYLVTALVPSELLGDGAGVLGDGLGSLGHGVLGELTRGEESDSGLDLPGGDSSVGVDLLQHLVDVDGVGLLPLLGLGSLLASSLLGLGGVDVGLA